MSKRVRTIQSYLNPPCSSFRRAMRYAASIPYSCQYRLALRFPRISCVKIHQKYLKLRRSKRKKCCRLSGLQRGRKGPFSGTGKNTNSACVPLLLVVWWCGINDIVAKYKVLAPRGGGNFRSAFLIYNEGVPSHLYPPTHTAIPDCPVTQVHGRTTQFLAPTRVDGVLYKQQELRGKVT